MDFGIEYDGLFYLFIVYMKIGFLRVDLSYFMIVF